MDIVVLDVGTLNVRAGFANDIKPRAIVSPAVVGSIKQNVDGFNKRMYFGSDAVQLKDELEMSYPIGEGGGLILNWNNFESLLDYLFKTKLQIPIEEYGLMIADPPLNSRFSRQKLTELAFERFGVTKFQLVSQPQLALYAAGRVNGLLLDCGHCTTTVAPVYDSVLLRNCIIQTSLAGNAISNHLNNLMIHTNSYDLALTEEEIRTLKEKLCYVALDFEREEYSNVSKSLYLPGRAEPIQLNNERYQSSEILFSPTTYSGNYTNSDALHMLCLTVREQVSAFIGDINSRNLLANIVIVGGSSVFPGLKERLLKETSALSPYDADVKVLTPHGRNNASWIGGSILALQPYFKPLWITKTNYEDIGPNIVNIMEI
ncbi:hypothetical protein GJ496_005551 [Pomphorhynchus laevis]|nr:hypothetical protein GJ496_005551 [Pomphorhynchus laevis]